MDRLNQLRGDAGGSKDSTLDTTSPPSESFMTANESPSKYFSLSEVDSPFDISGIKDVSLAAAATADSEGAIPSQDDLISNLSPIPKNSDLLAGYKIGKQIEAANILSGGVDIFDDNNSYDGDELVIDDNAEDEKSDKQLDSLQFKSDEMSDTTLVSEDIGSKDTEVVLQIDGKNVDAIDIGNGLYLYRKEGEEELAAVQIVDDDQHQPSFKFLKVRENAEGNLEVYEEIEIEVPKEVPVKEGKTTDKNTSSHVPIKDINKVINESACNKNAERKVKTPQKEPIPTCSVVESEAIKDSAVDNKSDYNFNGKMKFSESRKSPVIGTFTPMTYHSTPNKEGKPLTKTMVDQQLHPNRHSDNIKKTIEVHTDSSKQRPNETSVRSKDFEDGKVMEDSGTEKENVMEEISEKNIILVEEKDLDKKEPGDVVVAETIPDQQVEQALKPVAEVSENGTIDKGDTNIVEVIDTTEDDLVTPIDFVEVNDTVINSDVKEVDAASLDVKEIDNPTLDVKDAITESLDTKKVNDGSLDVKDASTEIINVKKSNDSSLDVKVVNNASLDVKDNPLEMEKVIDTSMEIEEVDKAVVMDVKETETKAFEKDDGAKKQYSLENTKEYSGVVTDKKVDSTNYSVETHDIKEVIATCDKTELEQNKTQNDFKLLKESSVPKETSPKEKETQKLTIVDNVKSSESSYIDKKVVSESSCPNKASLISDNKLKAVDAATTKIEPIIEPKEIVDKNVALIEKQPIEECKDVTNIDQDSETQCQTKKVKENTEIKADEKIEEKVNKNIEEKVESKISEVFQKLSSETPNVEKVQNADITKTSDTFTLATAKKIENPTKVIVSEPNVKEVTKGKIIAPTEIVSKNLDMKEKNISGIDKKPTNKAKDKVPVVQELKPSQVTNEKVENKGVMTVQQPTAPLKLVSKEKVKNAKIEPNKVSKVEQAKIPSTSMTIKSVSSSSIDKKYDLSVHKIELSKHKIEQKDRKEVPKINPEPKPMNNNHTAVPFGKWTDANRQEFLNKFKAKVPAASSNGNQIKNSNDLNRRDVLKKIDSQRQSSNALSKAQDATKLQVKNETVFSKSNVIPQDSKIPVKAEALELKIKPVAEKVIAKQEKVTKIPPVAAATKNVTASVPKIEQKQRTPVNYQDLIDKTIEDMLHRGAPKPGAEESKQNNVKKFPSMNEHDSLDAIEMKMNELHGIPFIERPPHELPQVQKTDVKGPKPEKEKQSSSKDKTTKIPNLLPYNNKPIDQEKTVKENSNEVYSEEEIIEHEPITGDIELHKKHPPNKPPSTSKSSDKTEKPNSETFIKDAIITEKDFEKFARRNSITYENCITVNFDGKEQHNVIQTVVEKDPAQKNYSKNDIIRVESKAKVSHNNQKVQLSTQPRKHSANKFEPTNDESSNRNQSKLQKAYHSALTAKRQMECPITIIEDKPVQVVFMDNIEFVPSQLNVQGQDLSPAKKLATESEAATIGTGESMDSDVSDLIDYVKAQEEVKVKAKHQRKQVLTPVEEPELELIEPKDLGLELSPKKKRKTEDDKDKSVKYPMRKKMYLLGSGAVEENKQNTQEVAKNPRKDSVINHDDNIHKSSVSAIDNLVKAAELIETQTENAVVGNSPNPNNQQSTPVKRGRGRPRKYPLPEGSPEKIKAPSPQKKPRLIDAKPVKRDTISDEEDSDGEIVKENWTMGKINENILCPICNKLFRTENVVFKHVKHCTGPSPNRSDSDKRSPRRIRHSQESDDTKSRESKSDDMDIDDEKLSDIKLRKETPKKRKSRDSVAKLDKDEVIIIEDAPDKEKAEKVDDRKQHESRKMKSKIPFKGSDLVCEFCGKTFRQLSYLVSHKLQHNKDEPKKVERENQVANKSVYSCEVCKKEFRKLHHLVQHRIIHNPSSAPSRTLRKTSSEQAENKTEKDATITKQSDDPSAGFRCEPCDKSFRKLHHLVEHRETHDGINRQKTTTTPQNNVEKTVSVHTCEICKKTFKKLQHLIEHKEQHLDTGSEKSDDKSVKSSLSTRDIIHECSLCYMVFPNEHSLNKHTVICQRKKRQSKQKAVEGADVPEEAVHSDDGAKMDAEVIEDTDTPKVVKEIKDIPTAEECKEKENITVDKIVDLSVEKIDVVEQVIKKELSPPKVGEPIKDNSAEQPLALKRDNVDSNKCNSKKEEVSDIPEKIKKVEEKEVVKIQDTPKKKAPLKDNAAPTVPKRPKTSVSSVPIPDETKPAVESSDDDEVRYMFNPNFKVEESEEKIFMKVRAKKRSSLQIERPSSKDLVKRRISLQHPPKIPRLKQKSAENVTKTSKIIVKPSKLEPVPSTDSDDSDVKYSFPKTIPEKTSKPTPDRTKKEVERKTPRKPLAEKRKTLSGLAKRKSLGKAVVARHKASPMKQVKRRTLEVEHRCDCGQLFSSAALLSRHTTLAHTPPRIRRRRSPPPDDKPTAKAAPRKSSVTDNQAKARTATSRKSSAMSDASTSNAKPRSENKPGRKSIKSPKTPVDAKKPKAEKTDAKSSAKPRRSGAHRGVPVPDKMRKLMQKNNK